MQIRLSDLPVGAGRPGQKTCRRLIAIGLLTLFSATVAFSSVLKLCCYRFQENVFCAGGAPEISRGCNPRNTAHEAPRPGGTLDEARSCVPSGRAQWLRLLPGIASPANIWRPFGTKTSDTSLGHYPAFAQEATQSVPWAYKLQFENEWVRVIRVHYEPREKLPPHAHTKWPCVYVYLNDGGPVIFRHKDWDHPELTRPATQAGSIRISPTSAVNEVHEVDNPNDTPSDFLRVEFKTEPVGRQSLSGRFYREDYPANENYRKVQFENEQLRITRLICARQKKLEIAAGSAEPALLVVLSAAAHLRAKSADKPTTLAPGQTLWVASGRREQFENLGDAPLELLRFDFRTAPVAPKERQKKGDR